MKYITEYRNPERTEALAQQIATAAGDRPMTFMEVCGTHTMALARFGIRQLLPPTIRLISGPGCPVCVTPGGFLDHAVALAQMPQITITTFGDMVRVPGSTTSLERERAAGADVRVVASTLDALAIARSDPAREVVFLGVGFETTTPTVAAAIGAARNEGIKNFSVLSAHKTVLPALAALLAGPVALDGFLLPGHVSTIIGTDAYRPLLADAKVGGVIAGFEPTDMLEGIARLVAQVAHERPCVENAYPRAVAEEGNPRAAALVAECFEPCDAKWRGLGTIPASGLAIREAFATHDAARRFDIAVEPTVEPAGCRCGAILTGTAEPADCLLFGTRCTPETPVGACMVSGEGTCAAHYQYRA